MTMNPRENPTTEATVPIPPEEQSDLSWDETLRLRFGNKTDEEIVDMAQKGDR